MSDTKEEGYVEFFIKFFIKFILIPVAVIAFFIGFSYGIHEDFAKTWHDIWHTTKVEKEQKKLKHEKIIANRTTSEDLKIRISVGLKYASAAFFSPLLFIIWLIDKGYWKNLLGLAVIVAVSWGIVWLREFFNDDPPEK